MPGHEIIEKNVGLMVILVILVIAVGGLVQIVPLSFQKDVIEPVKGLKPYTALQLTGRDIYIREGCNFCHTQIIRSLRASTERYGHASVAGEFVYDRPHLWGSKRTGPDLHRVGGKYPDDWHRAHLRNPRDVVPESIMPAYPWLEKNKLDGKLIRRKMQVLRDRAKHPYTDKQIAEAPAKLKGKTEMDAVIAYLQVLGTALKSRR